MLVLEDKVPERTVNQMNAVHTETSLCIFLCVRNNFELRNICNLVSINRLFHRGVEFRLDAFNLTPSLGDR